ncbi:MAG: ABC-F family ATP-binding cassette domain-containing protein [Deltaproteobacteria bacterium]|nr:ABC-F family ATP-binding cassette domain-containing protein [Deltaproteobacteria bacterium]
MSLITANNLSLSFGGTHILDRVNFQIGKPDRVGLVGPNGAGKTSLLRILAGEIKPDEGDIQISRGVRLGYLPQDLMELPSGTVLESILSTVPGKQEKELRLADLEMTLETASDPDELNRSALEVAELHEELSHFERHYSPHEAQRILNGLGFKPEDAQRPVEALSGGWRMRAALAALLFQRPDLLLLDEPTNHLDVPSVRWLDAFLEKWNQSMILICHDRQFLNRHIRRVLSFESEGLRAYTGNYDTYLESREQERIILENKARNVDKKVKEAQKFIERFRSKNTKARQAQSKIKMVKKLELVATHTSRKTLSFSFPEAERSGRVVLTLSGLSKRFGENTVFRGVDASVLRGDRIAIIGPNGCGKTTLLKIIAGELTPDEGTVTPGHNVVMSYYAQHHTAQLRENRTVLDEVYTSAPKTSLSFIRGVCGAFLFSDDQVEKHVGVLSGGERARVALAKLLAAPGNLMLMDEPTNHLDLFSSEALIQALDPYDGTLIFVSHNQSFVNRLATRIWDLSGERIEEHPGNLEEYFHHLSLLEESTVTVREGEQAKAGSPSDDKRGRDERQVRKREEALFRKKRSNAIGPIKKSIESLEDRIQKLEQRQEEISGLLAQEAVFQDSEKSVPLMNEYGGLRSELTYLLSQWEARQAELEKAEKAFSTDFEA